MAGSALDDLNGRIARLPSERRSAVTKALVALGEALIDESPRTLRTFTRKDAAQARNTARLELLLKQLREDTIDSGELVETMGLSRQRLAQLRDSGRLLGFQPPFRTTFWYPRWQFDGQWNPRPVVIPLLRIASEVGLSPLGLHLTLTNPAAGIDGTPLVELLDDHSEDVLEIIAGSGDIGS